MPRVHVIHQTSNDKITILSTEIEYTYKGTDEEVSLFIKGERLKFGYMQVGKEYRSEWVPIRVPEYKYERYMIKPVDI